MFHSNEIPSILYNRFRYCFLIYQPDENIVSKATLTENYGSPYLQPNDEEDGQSSVRWSIDNESAIWQIFAPFVYTNDDTLATYLKVCGFQQDVTQTKNGAGERPFV